MSLAYKLFHKVRTFNDLTTELKRKGIGEISVKMGSIDRPDPHAELIWDHSAEVHVLGAGKDLTVFAERFPYWIPAVDPGEMAAIRQRLIDKTIETGSHLETQGFKVSVNENPFEEFKEKNSRSGNTERK